MSIRSHFDRDKAVEVLLYITKRVPDMYAALKVLYFADKKHLQRYGRLICGDSYVAMQHGPVPSNLYDIAKCVVNDSGVATELPFLHGQDWDVIPQKDPDLDYLSRSDMECLDSAIDEYGDLEFGDLKRMSHEEKAFQEASENDFISLEDFASSLPEGELILEYLDS